MIWFSYLLIDVLIITVVSIAVLAVIFACDSLHIFTSGKELGRYLHLTFDADLENITYLLIQVSCSWCSSCTAFLAPLLPTLSVL
jgi:hypothetical protein